MSGGLGRATPTVESLLLHFWEGARLFGKVRPGVGDVKKAMAILDAAPKCGSPMRIAEYFLSVEEVSDSTGERFTEEWKVIANPMILDFFRTAGYPGVRGDDVPWCAVFACWCIERAGRTSPVSWSSGSFRCHGTETATPAAGDVVVFRNAGENEPCKGKGHVGFFAGWDGNRILTLGGNQRAPGSTGSICIAGYPGPGQSLHSFRRVNSFAARG